MIDSEVGLCYVHRTEFEEAEQAPNLKIFLIPHTFPHLVI